MDGRHYSDIKDDYTKEEDVIDALEEQKPESESQMQNRKQIDQLFARIFQIGDDDEEDCSNVDVTPTLRKITSTLSAYSDQFQKTFTCRRCDVKFSSRITAEIHLHRVHRGTFT